MDYTQHDDETKDETFVNVEDETGVKRLNRFPTARKSGKRFGLSTRGMTHVINAILEDLDMDHLYVSKTAVEKWNLQDGNNSLEKYEEESQGVTCVKFDGGTEKVAIGKISESMSCEE